MSKKKSSRDSGEPTDVVVVDTEDPVVLVDESGKPVPADANAGEGSGGSAADQTQAGEAAGAAGQAGDEATGPDADTSPKGETPGDTAPGDESVPPAAPDKPPRPRRSWFGLFNFLLILALAGAAGYYWWLEQQRLENQRTELADLRGRLATKVDGSRLDSSLSTLKAEIDGLGGKLGELETGQQGLRESSEKLYELFGRDRADWQLAEVEYLMRVAQHKLILENDFAGAAITLQAASDRIGLTGDPGLLRCG